MSEKIEFAGDYAAMLWALYTIRAVAEGFAHDRRDYECGCGSSDITTIRINDECHTLPICPNCSSPAFIKMLEMLDDESKMELFGF